MTETTSARVRIDLSEGLDVEYPNMSFNDIMTEISSEKSRRSCKTYRDVDISYAIEQIEGYRQTYPNISIEEIIEMIREYHENIEKKTTIGGK